MHVGINLVSVHHIRELRTHHEAPVYFATVFGVTCLNLLAGVGLGLALSVFFVIRRLSLTQVTLEDRAGKWHVLIQGTLTFASVPKLNLALSTIPAGRDVDIDETHEEWYKPASEGRPRLGRTLRRTLAV